MAFAGLRGTGDWGTDERPKNFREMILWSNPNGSAPLTALLSKARSESVDDPEFNWWEESLTPVRIQINYGTTYVTTDQTLTIAADGLRLVPGDILLVEKADSTTYDNELVTVSSVTSDTVIVIKRGTANTTPASIANNTYLTKLGSAFEEGSLSPKISQRNPTKIYNYTQIFKTKIGQTETALKTKARTGDAWKNDRKRKAFEHSVAMEMQFLFGKKYETTGADGKPLRYTGGLRQFITTNVTVFATTPTEDTLLTALYKVFDYNSESGAGDERIVWAGNGALNSLNKLAKSGTNTRINFDGTIKVYGMTLQRWTLPQGTFAIKTHPLLNLHGRYTNSMFVIDPTNLRYRHLRDTQIKSNVQANDSDSREDMWISEVGLEVNHEATMAYIGNFIV